MFDLAAAPRVQFDNLNALPKTSGVYIVLSGSEVVYVGQSKNIHTRWTGHSRKNQIKSLPNVEVCYVEMTSDDAIKLEKLLIEQLQPRLNWTQVIGNPTTVLSVRIPKMTEQSLERIMGYYELTKTDAVVQSIQHMYDEMFS